MRSDQIAIQLFTVREHMAQDVAGTLRQLAEIGYQAVEFAGFFGRSAAELRGTLDACSLRATSAFIPFAHWDGRLEDVMADLLLLGCSHGIISAIPPSYRTSVAEVRRLAEKFNHWGRLCQAEGLRLAYHNHAFEFAALEHSSMWDTFTESTDPALVDLELDVYWAQYAERDPVELIARYGQRVRILHLKDLVLNAERSEAPIGDGDMSWPSILAAGRAADTQWYIVEQDRSTQPMEDAARSLRHLAQLVV